MDESLQPEESRCWLETLALMKPGWQARDARAKIVPRYLRPVFDKRELLWKWCMRLAYFGGEMAVHAKAPHCRDIDMQKVVRLLQAAQAEVTRGMPDSQCPCPSWVTNCPLCEGTGWVSRRQDTRPRPRAIAKLMGRVQRAAVVTNGADMVDQAKTRLLCDGGHMHRIAAYGDLAKELSAIEVNRPIEVSGGLVIHEFETDGRKYEQTELIVDELRRIPLEDWNDDIPADMR